MCAQVERSQEFWGRSGLPCPDIGDGCPTINMLLPHLCYLAKLIHSRLNHMSIIMEISQKYLTLLSSLSRSLKVTGTNMGRSAT